MLDMDELTTILRQRVAGLQRGDSSTEASAAGAAHVDVFSRMNAMVDRERHDCIGGLEFTTDFLTGGLFSLRRCAP